MCKKDKLLICSPRLHDDQVKVRVDIDLAQWELLLTIRNCPKQGRVDDSMAGDATEETKVGVIQISLTSPCKQTFLRHINTNNNNKEQELR